MAQDQFGGGRGDVQRPDAPLENSYWKPMWAGDDTVTVAEQRREPHLILRPNERQVGRYGWMQQSRWEIRA